MEYTVCVYPSLSKATACNDESGLLTVLKMPVTYLAPNATSPTQLRRPYYPGHRSSYLELIPEEELEAFARMDDVDENNSKKLKSASTPQVDQMAQAKDEGKDGLRPPPADAREADITPMEDGTFPSDYLNAGGSSLSGLSTPGTPGLSRSSSSGDVSSSGSGFEFGQDSFPPVDRLTMFDILENFALPQRLERMQNAIHDNAERLRKQRAKITSGALRSKNNIVKRFPTKPPEEQLDKYRRRMRDNVDRISKRWNDAKTVTMAEKISFVTAVLNIFISGYLIGCWPHFFHYWYTAQLAYVSPTPVILVNSILTTAQLLHAGPVV